MSERVAQAVLGAALAKAKRRGPPLSAPPAVGAGRAPHNADAHIQLTTRDAVHEGARSSGPARSSSVPPILLARLERIVSRELHGLDRAALRRTHRSAVSTEWDGQLDGRARARACEAHLPRDRTGARRVVEDGADARESVEAAIDAARAASEQLCADGEAAECTRCSNPRGDFTAGASPRAAVRPEASDGARTAAHEEGVTVSRRARAGAGETRPVGSMEDARRRSSRAHGLLPAGARFNARAAAARLGRARPTRGLPAALAGACDEWNAAQRAIATRPADLDECARAATASLRAPSFRLRLEMTKGRVGIIDVREGMDVPAASREFTRRHGLPDELARSVQVLIRDQLVSAFPPHGTCLG